MQESRLFKIIYYLLNTNHATAPELAEKMEVSVRTIYRDIDALSQAGIPIYAETGRNGGIRLMHHAILDKALLSEEEKQEILIALQALNATEFMDNQLILHKISGLFQITDQNWLEVDFSRWGDKAHDNEKFVLLKYAILHCQTVKIHYASSQQEISSRIIYPLKLLYKARSWYLKAYCTNKLDFRTFKLTRILDFEMLPDSFSPSSLPSSEYHNRNTDAEQGRELSIVLRFPQEMAYRVYDEFDRKQVEQQDDGDLVVTAQMPEDNWLIAFLLSFGTAVEVLSPDYLRVQLAKQGKLIYEKNKP